MPNKMLRLPAVTVCPRRPFKGPINSSREEDYARAVYGRHEVLAENSFSSWDIRPFRSVLLGQCFTLSSSKPVVAMNKMARITLRRDIPLDIHSA